MCGPSGVGKSSLIKRLQTDFPAKVGFSVSHTTRNPRPGEVDGVDYHFVTREQMLAEIEAGAFIEYAHVHNNIYGTRLDYFFFLFIFSCCALTNLFGCLTPCCFLDPPNKHTKKNYSVRAVKDVTNSGKICILDIDTQVSALVF
jgi:guanylate kinase